MPNLWPVIKYSVSAAVGVFTYHNIDKAIAWAAKNGAKTTTK